MNIYTKLAIARKAFHSLRLEKSGHNKFAGYRYFELSDFLIPGLKCMADAGLVPVVSFDKETARMDIHDIDGDGVITITSPMATAALKGCHEIQNLGAVETYQRRYLWMAALEIVEHDAVDAAEPVAGASDHQLASIREYMDAGTIKPDHLQKRFGHGINELTADEATTILTALQEKAA